MMSYNEKAMIGAGGGELDEFMKRWASYVQWAYVRIPTACFECYRHYESWLAENYS
jgi:5-formyltetrahydrofolate cyclo-ligase